MNPIDLFLHGIQLSYMHLASCNKINRIFLFVCQTEKKNRQTPTEPAARCSLNP
jgi:hypothetical protein